VTLQGRGIVITRPAHQSARLATLIRGQGGNPILFPVIEIRDVDDTAALDDVIRRLDDFDLAVFVSPNAAVKGWAAIQSRRAIPSKLAIATIGRASARELRRLGASSVIAPNEGADSEALLAMPELQAVSGKRIVIFRGVGGREVLRETLEARGASVEYAECYRRARSKADVATLITAWDRGEIAALVATSSEGLRNLADMLGPAARARLAGTPLFVPHPRIAASARALGLDEVIVTASGDEAIAIGLERYFSR
jgi:uroporphyrinogen-III synthase